MALGKRLLASLVLGVGLVAALGGIALASSGAAAHKTVVSPLKKACGTTIVVQTDWFPEPEHGAVYQLAGTNGSVDAQKGRYTGQIAGTGVNIEIRAGGPFAGFQQPISQLYQDSSITLGYVNSDEAIQLSQKLPTIAIVSPLEFSPQTLFFNPDKFPSIHGFADIAKTNAKVLVFEGGAYYQYLVGRGWIQQSQLDTSFDGSFSRYIAADGGIIQQGFVTQDPYRMPNLLNYKGPVKTLLIRNSGYVPYPETLAARPDVVKTKRACFKLLVPLIQRAQIAFVKNPKPVNDKLDEIVGSLKSFWTLTPGLDAYAVNTMRKLKIVSNGPNCTLGDFSFRRLQGVVNTLLPIFQKESLDTFKSGLKAQEIATNDFINPKLGLPKSGCK